MNYKLTANNRIMPILNLFTFGVILSSDKSLKIAEKVLDIQTWQSQKYKTNY